MCLIGCLSLLFRLVCFFLVQLGCIFIHLYVFNAYSWFVIQFGVYFYICVDFYSGGSLSVVQVCL